ncbi:MAG: serine hydrolase domain-containing protein [Acidimicrobiales bacterium]
MGPGAGEVQGTCDERFEKVRDVLAANLDRGVDVGASVAVNLDGDTVVDIWGGWADEDRTRPWEAGTITNVWSTTKTMTNLCALILADAGEVDVDAAVSRYWPQFAAAGKRDLVLVRHLLAHTSGLAGWTAPMVTEDFYDWEKCTSLLAAQEPWWEPGTASGYHAVTQGYLVGEVVRRVTGQSLGEFFRQNVAGPLGADFHIGLPPEADDRVAPVIPPPPLGADLELGEIGLRCLGNPLLDARASWAEEWRRAEIPAAGGHGNARSVVAIQAAVANGGQAGGKRLLSAAGCEKILTEQSYGEDLVLGVPIRFGIGYGLPSPEMPLSPSSRACFWGGWGGSVIVRDMDVHLTVSYMMNKMGEGTLGDERGAGIVQAAYESLAG